MKKGFTMIELIFVIVILGILASVAIPRLAGTKADAEISAAVANLRTLVSDANVYYVARGTFENGTGNNINTRWSADTSVPVDDPTNTLSTNTSLKVAGQNCIDFTVTKENTAGTTPTPAYFTFAKNNTGRTASPVCQQVQDSESLRSYFTSRVPNVAVSDANSNKGFVAIGSNIKLVR